MSFFARKTRAKINLSLHITGTRANGYHELESIVAFADTGDEISVVSADTLKLSVKGEFAYALHENEDNLVLRAARALQRKAEVTVGAHLMLEKNLPVASGMGGGSGDAAATLLLLRDFWKLEIDDAVLCKLALSLGADVPMCLRNESAIVRGVGEAIEPITLPHWYVLLVNPRIALSTAEIFSDYAALHMPLDAPLRGYGGDWLGILKKSHNALQPAASARAPIIRELVDRISNTQGCMLARMSGSGATCYGLYETEALVKFAGEALAQSYPDFWLKTANLLVNKN